ncbi:hypothetical protein OMK64_17370 [Cellulomonas fimi]|uniref:hypothetical protein n=1 Tax=Cellulomonas fimi TaxID=1708 RepID=UPI00234DF641|nr:hypothetical protein [Cellulomonas fimi]MDC7123303.1 hypothetical protein [Cellulomonas fimi]
MLSKRTLLPALVAGFLSLALWLGAAAVHALLVRAGVPSGVVGFVAPATSGVTLVQYGMVEPWHVAAAVALVVAVAALTLPGAGATRTGFAPRVLAVWFAAAVGGVVAVLTSSITILSPMLQHEGLVPTLRAAMLEPIRAGAAWGATYGWVVGLATVALARRLERATGDGDQGLAATPASGVLRAAVVVGVVSGLGWAVAAGVHGWVDRTVAEHVTTARSELAATVSTVADWLAPVTTAADASPGALLVCGALVGTIAGALTYVAVRTTTLPDGRLVLVLAVWLSCLVAALVGAIPTVLVGLGLDPVGDGRWYAQAMMLLGPTDGGAAGLLYGWVPALLVLLVVGRATSRRPADPPAVADRGVDVTV